MKNRSGMTLIEVILALMLIGIIAVTFIPSSVNSFAIMSKSKSITQETFAAQEEVEDNIETVRKAIEKGAVIEDLNIPTLEVKFSNSSDKVKIDGKIIKGTNNNTDLIAFIPTTKKPEDPTFPHITLEIDEENVFERVDFDDHLDIVNLFLRPTSKLTAKIGDRETHYESKVYRLVHKLYVSKGKYNPANQPIFPEGFDVVNSIQNDLPNLKYEYNLNVLNPSNTIWDYKDKVIRYTVTQVSKMGRYGEIMSKSVLVIDEVPDLDLEIRKMPNLKLEGYRTNHQTENISGTHSWYLLNDGESVDENIEITDANINKFTIIEGSNTANFAIPKGYKDKWIVYSFDSLYKTKYKKFYSRPYKIDLEEEYTPLLVKQAGTGYLKNQAFANQNDKILAGYEDEYGTGHFIDKDEVKWQMSNDTFSGNYNMVYTTYSDIEANTISLNYYYEAAKGRLIRYYVELNDVKYYSNPIYVVDDTQFNILPSGNTEKALDIKSGQHTEGLELLIWNKEKKSNQRFRFIPSGIYYKIEIDYPAENVGGIWNPAAKLYLTAMTEITENYTVKQYNESGNANQNWIVETVLDNNNYYLRFRNAVWTDRYMYVGSAINDTIIIMSTESGVGKLMILEH